MLSKKNKRAAIESLVKEYYRGNKKYEGIDWKTKTIIYGDGGVSLEHIVAHIVGTL